MGISKGRWKRESVQHGTPETQHLRVCWEDLVVLSDTDTFPAPPVWSAAPVAAVRLTYGDS